MAKIRDATPKNTSGGYNRLFNNAELGFLISKLQSTVISAGSELERLIKERVNTIKDLDEFLQMEIMPDGVFLATKKEIKKSVKLNSSGSEPDFIIFRRKKDHQHCHIVELKDGHVFDTKKVDGEREALHGFEQRNSKRLPYTVSTHFCAFNQTDKQVIWDGFKRRINFDEAMTGKEFCELLEIDYQEIVSVRLQDSHDNIHYFINELLKISEIKILIEDLLR